MDKHCAWRRELKKHYDGDADRIGWTNCTPSKWSKEPWEVAKVFMLKMPKSQAAENTGPEKSDPSALLNFLIHCTYCHKYVNIKSAQRVIEIRNQAMHSLDLTFDRDTFNNHMEKLRSLVCDPKLASDPAAQKAAKEITKLKKEEFHLGANKACMDAEVRVLKDVMSEHKKQLQLYREELEDHGTRLDALEHSTLLKEEMLKTVAVLSDIVNNNPDLQCLKDQVLGLLELSTTVQQHEDRLGKAEGDIAKVKGDITEVKGAVSQLEEMVADQGAQIEVNTQKLQQLEAPSGSTISLLVLVDVFKKSVKKYYELKLSHFKPLIWNENFTLTLSDIFTQLELVPKCEKRLKTSGEHNRSGSMGEEQRKKLKSLDDLFNPDVTGLSTAPRCILIEGEAGGGKTTFLSKEALDGISQKTELGIRHDFVLLIRLRELRQGETIEEMVWDQCVPESINVQSIRAILQRNESRVLFLLDGYDELRPEARAAGQTIPKLLSGKLFPNSTIVITSRPSAGVQQHTRPDCHVHIMGFSSEHVEKYMKQYFTVVKKQKLTMTLAEHVKYDRLLNTLIQTPIFLLFVCVLWEEDQEMVSTGTMTGLYDNLLKCLVRKHCKREGVDMPTEGLPTEVTEPLLQLGKLALEALLRNETLLDLTEVEKVKVNCELLLKLGLVSLEVSSSKLHPRKQLNFSHKTMQEFLAGRYVAHVLVTKDIVELLQLTSITKVFELSHLLQFTCGCDSRAAQAVMEELIKLSSREVTHLKPEQFEMSHVPMDPDVRKSCQVYERFAHLCLTILSERPEAELLQAICQALPIVMLHTSTNSREAKALKYYMQNLPNLPDRLILGIYGGTDSRDTVQYLQQCFTTSLPGLRLDLRLSGQFDSPDETARLVSVLKNVPGLRALDLSGTNLSLSSLQQLVQGFRHTPLLEELDLYMNPDLGDSGMEVLQVWLSSVPYLAIHRLRFVNMTAVGMSSLAPYIRHLLGLRQLIIQGNNIGVTGLKSLSTIFPIFTAMQVLVLERIGISPTGMRTLVPALCQLTRLIKLDISDNAIGDPGLKCICLAAICHRLTAMKVLLLSETGISDKGISYLIKALPHLVQLQVLDVRWNRIGDSGIVSLVQTLCQPSSLEHNPLGDKSLTTAPHCNTTLIELDIGGNSAVTGAGLGRVTQLISSLPALTRLDMSGPRDVHLSDTAAMALAEALPRLPALERLDLLHISMEPAGFQAVVQAAEEHPTLDRLLYSRHGVPEGADTTASCLALHGSEFPT
ncbi:NLR family CARD domain-containing protein 4-like isoform X2 [Branchiostoma floridae x Branchiostoma japonicum]